MTPTRRIPVPGTLNFRDVGGYATADGRRVRTGLLFRSDNFAATGPEGWRFVASLGVARVIDLRVDAECDRAPSTIPDDVGIEMVRVPMGGLAAQAGSVVELLASRPSDHWGMPAVIEATLELLAEAPRGFARVVELVAPAGAPATVFHCTAGKDRTGLAAALVLGVLGVGREEILDDYELSTALRTAHRFEQLRPELEAAGVDAEAVRPFLSAPRPALEAALDWLDEHHGSPAAYLVRAGGLDPSVLDALRARFLA